jgi:hypothetical protein
MFSDQYFQMRAGHVAAREDTVPISEHMLQCIWYDQIFPEALSTDEGLPIKVLSPGWWNHQEGPDFKGAQIQFGENLRTGDVEIHLDHGGWQAHGHHQDPRYDNVLLHVVLDTRPPAFQIITSAGRPVPSLLLGRYLQSDLGMLASQLPVDAYPYEAGPSQGQCYALSDLNRSAELNTLINLAGEWRVLNKARALRERMDQAGAAQAVYEAFMYACGFGHFKHHFRAVARHLPYERARQLIQQDPLLLEAAFLQMGGLLPAEPPAEEVATAHFERLQRLRKEHLSGLKSLGLLWNRTGIRPANFPERRLAGAAHFLARTAREGLHETLMGVWREDLPPLARRKRLESLFSNSLGFWAAHCTWTGKQLTHPNAPIGPSRARSIIGNVFIPAGLAMARRNRDRVTEERVFQFFAVLPPEQDNHIIKVMRPRMIGASFEPRLTFQLQQGLLQLYQDWCQPNPSCHQCSIMRYLDVSSLAGYCACP